MDDFVIVGAGSAGCVLANRLSEFASVTLLEAGPRDHHWDFRLHMPAALSMVLSSKLYNWHYQSLPEPNLDNRRLYCPRGRVLGGSSAINGMIFVRGNPEDFDRWSRVYGLPDWEYDACLPYFRKSEQVMFEGNTQRGTEGLLPVSRGDPGSPLNNAWLSAGQQAGFPLTNDFNGGNQEGFGYFDRSIAGGTRQSTARTYLDAVRHRSNLKVVTGALTRRIIVRDRRAQGVEYISNGQLKSHQAGQVILCAGAINSPKLLMLSGLGSPARLKAAGIEPRLDISGIGQNLQDHLEIYLQYQCRQPVSLYPASRWFNQPLVGLKWLLSKKGPAATNHFEVGAFLKSEPEGRYPDLQYHFLPIAMDYDGKAQWQGHGFQLHVGPMKPTSRGQLSLNKSDPHGPPDIQFNYHTTREDREVMYRGIKMGMDIVQQPAFDELRGPMINVPGNLESEKEIETFIRARAESAYHPCGTCRMGESDDSVVDSRGNVHGMDALKVIDASIMPEITNGNLNAPVIMMAEKLADTLK